MTIHETESGVRVERVGASGLCSWFEREGGPREVHFLLEPESTGSFEEQLDELAATYRAAVAARGLGPASAMFRRCFLSDAANQLECVMGSTLGYGGGEEELAAVSCIEQPPLSGRKIALLAYHLEGVEPQDKRALQLKHAGRFARAIGIRRGQQEHIWATELSGVGEDVSPLGAAPQTVRIFHAYRDLLQSRGATLRTDAVRTWLFVQGVDANYQGMVDARREFFEHEGLTPRTHYLVSTGIEGRTEHPRSLVSMDAFAIRGLDRAQWTYLDSLDHLNRTDEYGVTFERGARLDHADRSHVYLSGTASIDAGGHVLHVGDVGGQVDRTLENMGSLFEAGGTGWGDVAAMIVYLRDPTDAECVQRAIERAHPGLPYVAVRAPVCRPTWLVEIEALAIVRNDDGRLPPY